MNKSEKLIKYMLITATQLASVLDISKAEALLIIANRLNYKKRKRSRKKK